MEPTAPVLKYINLQILHFKNDIIFDQTSHIKNTFFAVFLTNPTNPNGACDTPFHTDTSYKHDILEEPTIPPKERSFVENI